MAPIVVKSRYWLGCSSEGSGGICFLAFPASRHCLHFLACAPFCLQNGQWPAKSFLQYDLFLTLLFPSSPLKDLGDYIGSTWIIKDKSFYVMII